jgi:hypothetical protein
MNNDDLELKVLEATMLSDRHLAGDLFARSIRSKLSIIATRSINYEIKTFVLVIAVITSLSVYNSINGNHLVSAVCSAMSAVAGGLSIFLSIRRRKAINAHNELVLRLASAQSIDEARALGQRVNMALVDFAKACHSDSSSNHAFTSIERYCDALEANVIKSLESEQ